MDGDVGSELPPLPEEAGRSVGPPSKREPAAVLTSAMVVYLFIDLVFAIPLLLAPTAFFDAIGVGSIIADQLGGLRWMGAALLAWAVSGVLVLARPGGRAIFVTTGALQLAFAAVAFIYSWSVSEYEWATWYHFGATALLLAGAGYMSWARLRAREVLRGA